jgi:hypothetical protein
MDGPINSNFDDIPEAIQQRFVLLAAAFQGQTGAPIELIQRFMVETIKAYESYMEGGDATPEHPA